MGHAWQMFLSTIFYFLGGWKPVRHKYGSPVLSTSFFLHAYLEVDLTARSLRLTTCKVSYISPYHQGILLQHNSISCGFGEFKKRTVWFNFSLSFLTHFSINFTSPSLKFGVLSLVNDSSGPLKVSPMITEKATLI